MPTKTKEAPKPPTPAVVQVSSTIAELLRQRPDAQLVEIQPRTPPDQQTAKERALAGNWRVIHGSMAIGVPLDARLTPGGQEDPYAPRQVLARPGDIVWLSDEDAATCLDQDLIEAVDAKPSRVGKVWSELQRSIGFDPDTGKPLSHGSGKPWDYRACEQLRARTEAKNRRAAK